MTDEETMFRIYNPYRVSIDSVELCFAAQCLRNVRQALERGIGFRNELARSTFEEVMAEAAACRGLTAKKEAA